MRWTLLVEILKWYWGRGSITNLGQITPDPYLRVLSRQLPL
ncbi:MAG: hypothetical protein ACTMUB_08050 [cyanobacterium endosymbiont of Rhopalodia musculus]